MEGSFERVLSKVDYHYLLLASNNQIISLILKFRNSDAKRWKNWGSLICQILGGQWPPWPPGSGITEMMIVILWPLARRQWWLASRSSVQKNPFDLFVSYRRDTGNGSAMGAHAHFGSLIDLIWTRMDKLFPTHYYSPHQIFRPSDIPGTLRMSRA